jgi:hypothetical protein
LTNFYAWPWGDHLFIVLDNCLYSDPWAQTEVASVSSAGNSYPASDWTLGRGAQHHRDRALFRCSKIELAWFRAIMSLPGIGTKGKHVYLHSLEGEQIAVSNAGSTENEIPASSGRYYGRGSGLRLGGGSDYVICRIMSDHGGSDINLMHDHGFSLAQHSAFNGIPIAHCGTAGANSLFGGGKGWPHNTMSNSYGTPETRHLSYPNILDYSGNPMPIAIKKGFNCGGYCACTISDDELTVDWIWAAFTVDDTDISKQVPDHSERYIPVAIIPDGDGQTTLAFTPRDVGAVYKQSDVVSRFWETIDPETSAASNTDNLYPYDGTPGTIGDNAADEPYTDGVVLHESQGGENVHILAVPQTLYSWTATPVQSRRRTKPRHF